MKQKAKLLAAEELYSLNIQGIGDHTIEFKDMTKEQKEKITDDYIAMIIKKLAEKRYIKNYTESARVEAQSKLKTEIE